VDRDTEEGIVDWLLGDASPEMAAAVVRRTNEHMEKVAA